MYTAETWTLNMTTDKNIEVFRDVAYTEELVSFLGKSTKFLKQLLIKKELLITIKVRQMKYSEHTKKHYEDHIRRKEYKAEETNDRLRHTWTDNIDR
jgi:hypothetical protein